MEPITNFTDYPSLYPQIDLMKKELESLVEKLVKIKIREGLGGNEGIHKSKL